MKKNKKLTALISIVICISILFGNSATAQNSQYIDKSENTTYTELGTFANAAGTVFEFLGSVFADRKTGPDGTGDSSTVATPFLIALVHETPGFSGKVKTVFFIGTKVTIIAFSGNYCLVESRSGITGYVYNGWLLGGKEGELSLNREFDHVYLGGNNRDSGTGMPRTQAVYDGGGTVVYSTDNPDIISVDSKTGLITGKKTGTANLIVKVGTENESIPVYCIYPWKKAWTAKANKSTTVYSGTSTSTIARTTISSGTKFCIKGDDGGSAGWAYGYVSGTNTWGFVKINDISTKGTVSQYNNMTTILNNEKVPWFWPVINEKNGVKQNKNANFISSPYAPRSDSTSTTTHHRGIDITTGTSGEVKEYSVVSATSGTVKAVRLNIDSCGYCISIGSDCTDLVTGQKIAVIYMHLLEEPKYSNGKKIQPGDKISAGTIIGKVGNSNGNTNSEMGYHLHFETNNINSSIGDGGVKNFSTTINPMHFYMSKSITLSTKCEAYEYGAYWYNKNN